MASGTDKNRVFAKLLKPILKQALRSACSIKELSLLLREVGVETAAEELERRGDKVNTSRISVMTGLSREEVKRIREQEFIAEDSEETLTLAARVISRWQTDKRFVTKSGKPKTLTIGAYGSEFEQLVESVSKHINAGTILFELTRTGVASVSPRGIKLLARSVDIGESFEQAFDVVAADIDTLLSAVIENVTDRQQVPQLHLQTRFDNLDRRSLAELRRWMLQEGRLLHRRAREFLARHDLDTSLELEAESQGGAELVLSTVSFAQIPPDADVTKKAK